MEELVHMRKCEGGLQMKNSKIVVCVVGFVAVAIIGFLIIPPIMKKMGNKIYKSSAKKDEIDFDSLGPEIVKKDDKEGED